MDQLQEPVKSLSRTVPESSYQKSNRPKKASHFDMQHPEMMETKQILDILKQNRIRIKQDDRLGYDRNELLELFHKHVTPQPQRKPRHHPIVPMTKSKTSNFNTIDKKTTDQCGDVMDWPVMDTTNDYNMDWTNDDITGARKRKISESDDVLLPKVKIAQSQTSIVTQPVIPASLQPQESSNTNVRKLKRPNHIANSPQKIPKRS
jgi:hypothetical protein